MKLQEVLYKRSKDAKADREADIIFAKAKIMALEKSTGGVFRLALEPDEFGFLYTNVCYGEHLSEDARQVMLRLIKQKFKLEGIKFYLDKDGIDTLNAPCYCIDWSKDFSETD